MEPVARKRGNQDTGSTFQGAKDTDARFNQPVEEGKERSGASYDIDVGTRVLF